MFVPFATRLTGTALALLATASSPFQSEPAPSTPAATRPVEAIGYRVTATYPHDRTAFTEGLFWHDGALWESTGLEGRSDLRRVRLEDGAVKRRAVVPDRLFGEGIVRWGDEIVSVTWKTGAGFRWSLKDLKLRSRFRYPGEGWGLTSDTRSLILSDGTPSLRVLDPKSFAEQRRIAVTANGRPLANLNELEWIDGAIWANVWMTRWIVRIDPASGAVTGALDVQALMEQAGGDLQAATPNGIAYDPATRRVFVTGKNWSKLFVLSLDQPAR
ncbi:Glutamine cyclotransferase [Sphingomonas guangdongensis]|uniref:Glutamine cyclotransferase n=1 Tax=Sphingomonas guangdongensis TaxID=1141890 RepID=A0A285QEH6_9SPHN|nr:glutaminyl-peptide cyclotransferase [Sphingomonas guangdongensis]SOB79884.1 Glutamine cyclotransferase [Sphingomonas guangdongensis]